MKTIEIIIDAKGEVRLQTRGFAGESCREASQLLEQALGEVQTESPTAEMYQPVTESRPLVQRGQ
jgi:hypothetical protein